MHNRVDSFYHSPQWRKVSAIIKVANGNRCAFCMYEGRSSDRHSKLIADHIIPRNKGLDKSSDLDVDNLVPLCFTCHESKKHNTLLGSAVRIYVQDRGKKLRRGRL